MNITKTYIHHPAPEEIQLTHRRQGYFLNQRHAFSSDDQYLVYDNRNEDSKIGENGSIQLVDVRSREIQTIYRLENQTEYGAGAASFHPNKREVEFIHGLLNAAADQQYGLASSSDLPWLLSHMQHGREHTSGSTGTNELGGWANQYQLVQLRIYFSIQQKSGSR